MSTSTGIEWTDATWNPVTGCTKVSPGCKHCYAERLALRLQAMGNARYANAFNVTLHSDLVELPLHWRRPRRIFVNSMSDLFHRDVPDEFIARVFGVMRLASIHTFQVLTKRPQRMAAWVPEHGLTSARKGLAGGEIPMAARVLAVDIPSGLDCNTGQPLGPTVRANHTVTFVAPKKGFAEPAAQPWVGRVHVVDIGTPRERSKQ